MMKKYNRFLVLLVASLIVVGCSSKTETFKQEAENFCNVYDPENWRNFKNTGSYFEFQDELVTRISKIVVTAEFRNIFLKFVADDSRPNPYSFYKSEIEKVTGEEWNCPYAKDFYSVEWEIEPSTPDQGILANFGNDNDESIIRLEQNGDYLTNPENEVVVWIDKDGNYYINSSDTAISDALSLKEALSKQKYQKVIIRADGETQHQYVVSLIDVVKALRIPEIAIETKSE